MFIWIAESHLLAENPIIFVWISVCLCESNSFLFNSAQLQAIKVKDSWKQLLKCQPNEFFPGGSVWRERPIKAGERPITGRTGQGGDAKADFFHEAPNPSTVIPVCECSTFFFALWPFKTVTVRYFNIKFLLRNLLVRALPKILVSLGILELCSTPWGREQMPARKKTLEDVYLLAEENHTYVVRLVDGAKHLVAHLEVCFCIDGTGSMKPSIAAVSPCIVAAQDSLCCLVSFWNHQPPKNPRLHHKPCEVASQKPMRLSMFSNHAFLMRAERQDWKDWCCLGIFFGYK